MFVVHDQPAGVAPPATGTPLLVLASGSNRVSTEKLRAMVGATVTRPDADAVRRLTGFAIGGIPPLAHDTPARVLMDPHLLEYDTVWAPPAPRMRSSASRRRN